MLWFLELGIWGFKVEASLFAAFWVLGFKGSWSDLAELPAFSPRIRAQLQRGLELLDDKA